MSSNNYTAKDITAFNDHDHLLERINLTFGDIESMDETFSKQKNVAVREITDNAVDEVRGGYGTKIKIKFFKDYSFQVVDSGRGLPVDIGHDSIGRPCSGIFLTLGVIKSGGKFKKDSDSFSSGLNGVGASSTVHVSKRTDVTVYRDGNKYSLSFKDGVPGFFDENDNPDANFEPLHDTFFMSDAEIKELKAKNVEIKDYTYIKIEKDDRSAEEQLERPTGTSIKCWIRDEVFASPYKYSPDEIIQRMKNTAYLVPILEVEIYNELDSNGVNHEFFHFPRGVEQLVEEMSKNKELHEKVVNLKTEGSYTESVRIRNEKTNIYEYKNIKRRLPLEVAFKYDDGYDYNVNSFVNTIHTTLGGVHEDGFKKAFVEVFNESLPMIKESLQKTDKPPIFEDYSEGLNVVINAQISEPTFSSQTKQQLSGKVILQTVKDALYASLKDWVSDSANEDLVKIILTKVIFASRARENARKQRELNRQKNKINSASLPIKLIDCDLSGEDTELFICEGDSARTSLKNARDGKRNAILPVKGKIINVVKNTEKKALDNSEIQDIITCIGGGFGTDFDINKMRYERIVIAVDADPDGNNIACLIYALMYKFFPEVVHQNKLFKVETPLFTIVPKKRGVDKVYAYNDKERDEILSSFEEQSIKCNVTRLKGLGEVNADDLEITAINRETRRLVQITYEDVKNIDNAIDVIFGNDTDRRKDWIAQHEIKDYEDIM